MEAETTIIVAGLRRREDRRAAMLEEFKRLSIERFIFAQDIFLSVDWQEWTTKDLMTLRHRLFPWMITASPNLWWSRELRLGEIACTLTHWNIWCYACKRGYSRVIVLEDDAELLHEFKRRELLLNELSRLDSAWGLLYFGREKMETDRGTLGIFVVPGFSYCTWGYALSSIGIRKFLDSRLVDQIIPVDEFLPAMFMPHPRSDVRARFPKSIAAYSLRDHAVLERETQLWGSDTEESPNSVIGDRASPNSSLV